MIQKPIEFLLLALALVLASCGGEAPQSPTPEKALLMRETPENDSLVQAFGVRLAEALYEEDADTFNAMFHWDRFMDLALELPREHQDLSNYREQFKKGLTAKIKTFPQELIENLNEGGFYDFLYFYFDEGLRTYRLMYRLYSESGINYHDYILRKSEDALYLEDLYIYASGETLSTSTRNLFLASLPSGLLGRIMNPQELKDTSRMLEAMRAYESGSFGQAYYKLSMLEGPMRNLKSILALRIQMASQLDQETYMEAMASMMEILPEDPTMALLTLDYYVLNQDFESALRILEILETETGDSFLNLMRGNLYYQSGDYPAAVARFHTLVGEYPDFMEGRLSYMSALAMTKDYSALLGQLDTLKNTYAVPPEDLQTYIESEEEGMENPFAVFMETPGYRQWKDRHL
ncbi:tetratricopeptide repeat protein [Robiginitalea sediminis]|uniref:tetratricopeptide repeat protein n=1 Tax=Robiginitalea sediminis TaxID=1982593 RepID=UPI000B4B0500|nr:tetratricopeptide repeat protein [Robiginitalea sediminis]